MRLLSLIKFATIKPLKQFPEQGFNVQLKYRFYIFKLNIRVNYDKFLPCILEDLI